MKQGLASKWMGRTCSYAVGIGLILLPGLSWGLEIGTTPPSGTTGDHLPRRCGHSRAAT